MDYEKKYNEALERARKIRDEILNNEIIGFPGQITDIFPELRESESEDERIRKKLIMAFEAYDVESSWNGFPVKSILAWLEKQKEQKPVEWSEEDKTRLTNILIMLQEYVIHHYSKDDVNKSIDWLKALPERFNLQPKQEWS